MSVFNFSLNNLRRWQRNIMSLFSAVDSDLDSQGDAIEALSDRVDDIRDFFEDGNVTAIVINDSLYDNAGSAVLDSGGSSVKASAIYVRREGT